MTRPHHPLSTIDPSSRIFVAGHRGLVGSAIVRALESRGCTQILTAGREELDLRNQTAVEAWFREHRPELVFLAAGTVGGILANSTRPAEFLYDNLMIHATVAHASFLYGVRRLLYLGSSCIYPRNCPQPMREEHLLSGTLEPTNEPYAVAKIAGIKLCQSYRRQYGCDFISAMPTNLYGPGDNFDLQSSHVLPALLRKLYEARLKGEKSIEVWGSGAPKREFLHVDDLANACLFLMDRYDGDSHVNVGTGVEVSIRQLATQLRDVVAPGVALEWDSSKPDGTLRKLLDVSRLRTLGWQASIDLDEGIRRTHAWFRENYEAAVRGRALPATGQAQVAGAQSRAF